MRSNISMALYRPLKNILTVLALIAPAMTFGQALTCSAIFAESSPLNLDGKIDGSWRKYPNDQFMAFRANAPHLWNWLSVNRTSLMRPTGIVAGDMSIVNFGDIPMKDGSGKFAVIDVDDSGVNAPLAGDFFRYTVGNQLSPYKVSMKDLYKAYVDGVAGKKMDKPDCIAAIKEASDRRDFKKRQAKLIASLTDGNTFSAKAGVTPLAETSAEVQRFYEKVRPGLEAEIQDFKILDIAFRTKDTGGSQKIPRFWYLLEKDGEKHIWEFKMEAEPATSLYVRQPDPLARFQYVADTYRPRDPLEGPFRFIQADEHVFLLRERLYFYFDLDPMKATTGKDIKNGKEVSLYLANKAGQAHGAQANGDYLLRELKEPGAYDSFVALVNRYISETAILNEGQGQP